MNIAEFFLGSIPLLLQFYVEMYRETDLKNTMVELESEFNVPVVKKYDFIIVGGGSAGCVLAGRLSEHYSVLLLEAGGSPPPATYVPYFTADVGRDPSINYFFNTVPQANAALSSDGVALTHTGRMLGGSGSHNDMVHSRGSPRDYDNWATLLNDDSFNYTNILKFFKRMETFVGPKYGNDSDDYYGNDGPIEVYTSELPILGTWLEAGRELGYEIGDPNGFQREGFAPMNVASKSGRRSSSYIEYVKPYEHTRNTLTVLPYSTVSEILLDDNKKAYGVAYSRHGFPQLAHAEKEIILSAGAFSSPLLLMKSGIGPVAVLNAAEIPVKVPIEAVGNNLSEHVCFIMTGFTVNDTSLFPAIRSSDAEKIFAEYEKGEGVLSIVPEGPQCFIRSSVAEPGWPDLWLEIAPHISIDGEQEIVFLNVVGRPRSKGTLSLDTEKYRAGIRDDVELALIDYQFLTHPDDVTAMLDGVNFIFRIVETDAFKRINLTYSAPPDPACSAFTFLSIEYWNCKMRQDTYSWIHMVGTCRLGSDSDDSNASVVDTKFRVRGVSNLRIVDASVIPEVTNANLNAPVMMLAEKAAEEIINLYGAQSSTTSSTTTTTTTTTTLSPDTTPESNGSKSTVSNTVAFTLISGLLLSVFYF
ncbi:oxygen-dependent choline dehydrogenase 1-like [Bradysia coprophila]|uniref:oxygen-dependent choline dehydrogenase 1-like n=1 Tax=Bradysia coprophila TaxID=38358 RepID=UPI00187D89FF|nr:oxygen-dependent choline dehydrogenase 1-like [Bradysia coprophila]XP_037037754.1 oxygen-dependent choline dehydrogenase 1-like [Bradysia coprophila]